MIYTPDGSVPPWANLGQCCGAAAVGTFLLALADVDDVPVNASVKAAARARALALADAIAANHTAPAEPAARGRAVPSPEEHADPLVMTWQSGWMQGAAGVGSFLLHAHAVATGQSAGRRAPWPDEPWVF